VSAAETAAMLGRLRATGLPTGDARKPDGAGWQGAAGQSPFSTYLVLYPIEAQRLGPDASLGQRTDAPVYGYQVTAVGNDRRSAETGADIAARALLAGPPLELAGSTRAVQLVHTAGLGVTVDESQNPPLFVAVDRYRLDCSAP
jgi:hypothetical protein